MLFIFASFLDQIQRADGVIKLKAAQVVFDAMLVHGIPYLSSRQALAAGGGPEAEQLAYSQITGFLLGLLEDDDESIQAVAAEGMAKLMLAGMVDDDEALRSLVLVYMSPETVANQEMRQCLSYFLPVYCLSSSANQRKMQRVMIPILQVLTEVYNEIAASEDASASTMLTPLQVGLQLLEWSDPSKAFNLSNPAEDRCLHFDIGLDLLQTLFATEDREERKVLVSLLGKLSLPEEEEQLDLARGKTFFLLCAKLKEGMTAFEDTATRNAFHKFEVSVAKRFPEVPPKDTERARKWRFSARVSVANRRYNCQAPPIHFTAGFGLCKVAGSQNHERFLKCDAIFPPLLLSKQ